MLLQRLKEFADQRMALPPPLYSGKAVRYIVELDRHGVFLGVTDTADPASPRAKKGVSMLVPQVSRSVAITPLLLADNAEYTLGLAREASKPERVAACHQAYCELVTRCAAQALEPELRAVLAFLQDDPATKAVLPAEFDRGATITFRVGDQLLTELPSVQAFWAAEHDPALGDATVMQCIICGQERPVLDRLQGKIKGVPGGQTAGTAIISANAAAFESYGLEASLVAPTCADCGERFTKALNHLLASEQHRVIIAGSAFVFWTRAEIPFDFGGVLKEPEAQDVRFLLRGLREGRFYDQLDASAFYSAVLSASGGRAVIRDWVDTTVGAALVNLGRWFEGQALADDRGGEARAFGLYQLAGATVRELRDLPPTTPRALIRSALAGTPLPLGLLYQAVRRNRAEQGVTRPRAALIKLVLNSQTNDPKEKMMPELDSLQPDPAYRYGRLLAVLADIQEAAIGKAAIIDRFYGTASSAPASVFGRLLRGAQPHLAKLERDRPGIAYVLEQRLEQVMSGIDAFLPTLTLEQQGRFALGFYHQRAHERAERKAAAERKKAGATEPFASGK